MYHSKWFEARSIISLSSVIVRVTLKMTSAQVVEMSVTVTNSSFRNFTHPYDRTRQTKKMYGDQLRAMNVDN